MTSDSKAPKPAQSKEDHPDLARAQKTLCVLPWIHISNTTDGRLQVCCKGEFGKNLITDDHGQPLKIHEVDDYAAFWNNSYMKNLRREMMSGQRPAICQGCYKIEDRGAESHRQAKNIEFEQLFAQLLKQTQSDGSAPVHPALFDLRLSNVCNLRCRMCNPWASNQWIEDWNALFNRELDRRGETQTLKKLNWYEKQRFWKTLEKYTPYIEQIFFAGGEPTLIQQQYQLLESFVEVGAAAHITLSYNTNLTHLPERLLQLWRHFKAIKIYCSIDAYGALNDYIRYPSSWSVVDANLRRLDQILPEFKSADATICSTVMAYNITRLDELFTYLTENFNHILRFPHMEVLTTPRYLDIRVLPNELKELAAEKLLGYKERYQTVWETKDLWFVDDAYSPENNYHKYLIDNWSHKIDHMIESMKIPARPELRADFVTRTHYFDRTRGQSLSQLLPEFKTLMEP